MAIHRPRKRRKNNKGKAGTAAPAPDTLDSLPHNGAVVTLLAVCGSTHGRSYFDIVMVAIVGAFLGPVAVIVPGSAFGSF